MIIFLNIFIKRKLKLIKGGYFIGICASTYESANTENIQQDLTEAFETMNILVENHSNNCAFLASQNFVLA